MRKLDFKCGIVLTVVLVCSVNGFAQTLQVYPKPTNGILHIVSDNAGATDIQYCRTIGNDRNSPPSEGLGEAQPLTFRIWQTECIF